MRSRESLLRLNRFKVEDCRRQVADMDMMINDLMRKHDDLDAHVKFEEQRTGVSDVNNVNYSMAAKSVRGRRDNTLRTVAELRDQQGAPIHLVRLYGPTEDDGEWLPWRLRTQMKSSPSAP